MQIEQTGTGEVTVFSVKPEKGTWLHVGSLVISLADEIDSTLANGTIPNLSYNKILGINTLATGVLYQRIQDNDIRFSRPLRQLSDFLQTPKTHLQNAMHDGTNTYINIESLIFEPLVLKAENNNEIRLVISEDLSDLLLFRARAACKVVRRALDKSRTLPMDSRFDDQDL